MHFILSKNFDSLFNINISTIINTLINEKRVFIIFCAIELIIVTLLLLFSNRKKNIYHSNTVKLTNKIEVPVPIGDGQYGTSWWLDKKDYSKIFKCNILDRNKKYDKVSFSSGGVIVNFEKKDNLEKYYYIDDNLHLLLVGSSGSGKSRSIIIPTITMLRTCRRKYVY